MAWKSYARECEGQGRVGNECEMLWYESISENNFTCQGACMGRIYQEKREMVDLDEDLGSVVLMKENLEVYSQSLTAQKTLTKYRNTSGTFCNETAQQQYTAVCVSLRSLQEFILSEDQSEARTGQSSWRGMATAGFNA